VDDEGEICSICIYGRYEVRRRLAKDCGMEPEIADGPQSIGMEEFGD
jgi:hypothetical protein